MSKRILLIFTAIFTSIAAHAGIDHNDLWTTGNQYFEAQNYDSAAYYYKKIADQKPNNAEVYYNLGNTYYRLNNIGKAVLNYERALKIDGAHTQAADNLYLTQSRIENRIQTVPKIFFLRWWQGITNGSYANLYAVLAILIFIVAMGYFIAKKLSYINFDMRIQLKIAILVLSGLFALLAIVAGNRLTTDRYAIVMQHDTPLTAKPEYSTKHSKIPEGTKLLICSEKDTWYEVTLPDGRNGWLQKDAIEKI